MDIKTFVSQTLIGIVSGVEEAQAAVQATGARVNPRNIRGQARASAGAGRSVDDVRFNIAVTASDATEGGGGIQVMGVRLGADGNTAHSEVSHVSFSIPVCWPVQEAGQGGQTLTEQDDPPPERHDPS